MRSLGWAVDSREVIFVSRLVAVCIVTHDNKDVIGPALDAIAAQAGVDLEIHVWDNASRDGTREEIARRPAAILHSSEYNLGFCAANNRLIAATETPLILFLNPDTQLQPEGLARLVAALSPAPADVAGVGPKLLWFDQVDGAALIDSAGMRLSKDDLSPHDRGQGEIDRGQYDEPAEYFGPSFACALMRREAMAALAVENQLLDERFFAYYEDVDLAWRAQRLGWKFLYEPRAVCRHRRGQPQQHGVTLAARAFINRYLMLIANEDGRNGLEYLWRLLPRELARLIWKSIRIRGFAIAWRMLRDDWRYAWQKRRRLTALAGSRR